MIPLWEMSLEELDAERGRAAERERLLLVRLFGDDGARRYRRLARAAESVYDVARADAAYSELELMRGGLSEGESDLLFGSVGDCGPCVEEVKDYVRALSSLDYSTPGALGESLKYAFIRVGEREDPDGMSEAQRVGFAQIRAAAEHAAREGWGHGDVLEAAGAGIRGLYDDRDDAELMSRGVAAMARRAESAGCWYYAVRCGGLALAP